MLVFVTYSIIFTKKIQTSMLGWSDYVVLVVIIKERQTDLT